MKVKMRLEGPVGEGGAIEEMWGFDMFYKRLRPEGLMEITSACRAMRHFVHSFDGDAAGDDPQYTVSFEYAADDALVPRVQGWEELFVGEAVADELLYSQAAEMQNAGLALLKKLMSTAEMEIKSGQRR